MPSIFLHSRSLLNNQLNPPLFKRKPFFQRKVVFQASSLKKKNYVKFQDIYVYIYIYLFHGALWKALFLSGGQAWHLLPSGEPSCGLPLLLDLYQWKPGPFQRYPRWRGILDTPLFSTLKWLAGNFSEIHRLIHAGFSSQSCSLSGYIIVTKARSANSEEKKHAQSTIVSSQLSPKAIRMSMWVSMWTPIHCVCVGF